MSPIQLSQLGWDIPASTELQKTTLGQSNEHVNGQELLLNSSLSVKYVNIS